MVKDRFIIEVSPEFVKRQKEKARLLRKTRWWKKKISKGQCYYCGKTFKPSELTMDHVVPIIRGGLSIKSNLVPACKECNSKKKYLLPFEWDEYLKKVSTRSNGEDSK